MKTTKTRTPRSQSRKDLELWQHGNVPGRRAFLDGPAAKLAGDVVDRAGVLSWHADEWNDAGGLLKSDFDLFLDRALAALGYPRSGGRDNEVPFKALMDLTDDVAVRAYLVGVAVGRRIGGAR